MSQPGILRLRGYQEDAVWSVLHALRGGMCRPAVVLPTGAGKTVVFAALGTRWAAESGGRRVLVLAHTTELVDQAMAKWRSVAPGVRVGRVQANANETLARVIVASVQTLRSENRRKMIRDVGMIIVDECHHAVARTYLDVLEHYGAMGPVREDSAVAVGFTATMMRGDDLALGEVWQDVVYERSIAEMIAEGHLVRPRGIHVQVDDLDLSKVRTTRGDYNEGQLGQAIEESLAPSAIAKAVAEHAQDRKMILFAPTVSSAGVIADALSASGAPAALVHGGMPAGERRAVLDAYRRRTGGLRVLANCQLATEGFDDPETDAVVVARPTKSPVLYRQMVGRSLRPYPGKSDALILDVVGASMAHSLVGGITLFGEKLEKKDPEQQFDDVLQRLTGFDENEAELDDGQTDAWRALVGGRDGPLRSTEIDLFVGSSMAWMRTRGGVFFLPAGDRYLAILPSAPKTADQWLSHFSGGVGRYGYDVLSMHKNQRHTERWIIQGVEDLSYAMAWAEGDVAPGEKTTAIKERSWRARAPSDKLRGLAERLRIYVPPGARMGEVSNMVTVALASQRIDPMLPEYAKKG